MKKIFMGICVMLFVNCFALNVSAQPDWAKAMPKITEPVFPQLRVSIVDYGAEQSVTKLCSNAINKAIDEVSRKGGGTVVIPRGYWMSGPIVMKSKVNLYLEKNAFVSFSSNIADYPVISTVYEGHKVEKCQSPISGWDLHDVAITGSGTFEASGERWRPVKRYKLTENQWKGFLKRAGKVIDNGSAWVPDSNASALRPVLLDLQRCNNVLLEGVTFKNSPAWNLHPDCCTNITLRDVKVFNPWYAQNGDALDLESCSGAVIEDCLFDAGDDAICIKSGRDAEGRKRGKPTENVIIRNCTVLHGHGGFVIGSEMSGGVRNLFVTDCTFIGTDVGLRFKSTRGRGGVVENIYIQNINMKDIAEDAIIMDMFYGGRAPGEGLQKDEAREVPKVDETTPCFRDIEMHHLQVEGAGRLYYLNGLPEMPLKNITIDDVKTSKIRQESYTNHVEGLRL